MVTWNYFGFICLKTQSFLSGHDDRLSFIASPVTDWKSLLLIVNSCLQFKLGLLDSTWPLPNTVQFVLPGLQQLLLLTLVALLGQTYVQQAGEVRNWTKKCTKWSIFNQFLPFFESVFWESRRTEQICLRVFRIISTSICPSESYFISSFSSSLTSAPLSLKINHLVSQICVDLPWAACQLD